MKNKITLLVITYIIISLLNDIYDNLINAKPFISPRFKSLKRLEL